MKIIIHTTKNGWLVTNEDGFLSSKDIAESFVFRTATEIANHLYELTRNLDKRKSNEPGTKNRDIAAAGRIGLAAKPDQGRIAKVGTSPPDKRAPDQAAVA